MRKLTADLTEKKLLIQSGKYKFKKITGWCRNIKMPIWLC